MLSQKEMTKHIRGRVKQSKIKARVRMDPSSGAFGDYGIQVFPISFEARFTSEEAREIALIAKVNKLTLVCGMEIDLDIAEATGGMGFTFYMPK